MEAVFNENSIELDIEKIANQELVEKVLKRMSLKYREVLILKFLEEKDYTEISDILEKPMGTIGTLINRAKKQFKKEMEKMEKEFYQLKDKKKYE